MKTKTRSCLALVALALSLAWGSGCATAREVKVEAMARLPSPDRELHSYTIRTNPQGPADSLRDREATRHIKTALSAQGLWEADDAAKADLVIEVDYGIDPPRVRYDTVKRPVYARLGNEDPQFIRREGRQDENLKPRLPPHRRVVGFEEVPVPVMIREKHLTVSGRENLPLVEGRAPPEIFRISASIEDESTDLRGSLPLLAAAVMGRIGHATDAAQAATVREEADAVAFIKKGL